jgi:hypothetical protein
MALLDVAPTTVAGAAALLRLRGGSGLPRAAASARAKKAPAEWAAGAKDRL